MGFVWDPPPPRYMIQAATKDSDEQAPERWYNRSIAVGLGSARSSTAGERERKGGPSRVDEHEPQLGDRLGGRRERDRITTG